MSDEYRHDLERRWHDETWCAIAGSPECGCGCIPVAEEIARAMCDRIDELEAENRRLREALQHIADPIKYLQQKADAEGTVVNGTQAVAMSKDPEYLKQIARAALSQENKP